MRTYDERRPNLLFKGLKEDMEALTLGHCFLVILIAKY